MTKTGTVEAAPRRLDPGARQHSSSEAIVTFEPEFVTRLKTLFEELIVFNRTLGLQITILARSRHGHGSRCGPS